MTSSGPSEVAKSFPFARAQAHGHLLALKVAGAPVVHDREAGDDLQRPVVGGDIAAFLTDDAGQLELEVERLAAQRRPDRLVGADHAGGVREVEDRHLVPLGLHVEPAELQRRLDVLLEAVEIADAGDGGQGLSHGGGPPCRSVDRDQSVPRRACSRSMASKRALKFPLPKLFAPWRWMISKKSVGRSSTGLVKICSR